MPARLINHADDQESGIIKLTNCRVLRGSLLVKDDLWISNRTGKILDGQDVFFESRSSPDQVIDLNGRIVSPGFIETQINGAFGFDLSANPDDIADYQKGIAKFKKELVTTGVTSVLPTLTTQSPEVYQKLLPHLGPSGATRNPRDGTESLGAHCEGPFLNQQQNGCHTADIILTPDQGISSLEACYGAENLDRETGSIRLITIAPEQPGALSAIQELNARNIIASIGHSAATYEIAKEAIAAGATTITHLFNAMNPLHHRNPGVFGLLGSYSIKKPFYGIIADGIHLHPTTIKIAWNAHPDGLILVTDAMFPAGLADGIYDWTNGEKIKKQGHVLTLVGSDDTIAGGCATLIDCMNNFLSWTKASIPDALNAVTSAPAKLLGLDAVKGCLEPGADADLVVLDELAGLDSGVKLKVDQVWKFGVCIHGTAI